MRRHSIASSDMTLERSTNAAAAPPRGLRRILGLGFGLAVIIGSTLGVGILRTPGLVAGQVSSPVIILTVWVVGGLYTFLCAVCLAELGTMYPKAGGYYVYARHAFGDTLGFAVGWTDWITYCAVLGYVSIAVGEFAVVLVPALDGFAKILAVATLMGLVVLQVAGIRVSSRFQEWTTAVKFVAFVVVMLAAIVFAPGLTATPGASAPASFVGLIVALQSVVISYGGWQSALYFTEEDRDPDRNLPRSMVGGVASVIVVYLLVNVALLAVLPVADLARSTLPAADAAQVLVGVRGRQVITVLSIISLPPMLNAIMMIGTRILFALGRDGLLWKRTAAVSAAGTPVTAMLLTTAVAVALIASGTFQRLVAVVSFFLAANYSVCCLALVMQRRREPDRVRPFRAWGYPWSAYIVLAGAAVFMTGAVAGDTANAAGAVALLMAGLAVRLAMRRHTKS